MSLNVKCDQCGKVADRRGLVGWWSITRLDGMIVARSSVVGVAGEYCSTACVAERAEKLR